MGLLESGFDSFYILSSGLFIILAVSVGTERNFLQIYDSIVISFDIELLVADWRKKLPPVSGNSRHERIWIDSELVKTFCIEYFRRLKVKFLNWKPKI